MLARNQRLARSPSHERKVDEFSQLLVGRMESAVRVVTVRSMPSCCRA